MGLARRLNRTLRVFSTADADDVSEDSDSVLRLCLAPLRDTYTTENSSTYADWFAHTNDALCGTDWE